jgi:hypothetical protein
MRLHELGLSPATLTCLRNAGIHTTYCLLTHSWRELIWHSSIGAEEVYEVLCRLTEHGMILPPTPKAISHMPNERNLEVFRLRVVEGLYLTEIGDRVGIGVERVRQILAGYFGLRGSPPAVKTRHMR